MVVEYPDLDEDPLVPEKKKNHRAKYAAPEHGMVGESPALREALRCARKYAGLPAPALITGPTGSGKEPMARYLHEQSGRSGRFIAISCPNIPPSLLESELFGHAKGAFTGATAQKTGAFVDADGGTLFLDEIGDLPLELQPKLLRVLQEGTVSRLGETEERRVNVRVVVATWKDLPGMVAERTFREDLYERLAWCEIQVPPLAARGTDVVLIARNFLAHSTKLVGGGGETGESQTKVSRRSLARDAESVLLAQPWPGNVRQLQRVLFRASITGSGRAVTGADIARVRGLPASISLVEDPKRPSEVVESVLSENGVAQVGGLKRTLGASRSTVFRILDALRDEGRACHEGMGRGSVWRLKDAPTSTKTEDPRWATAREIAVKKGQVTRADLAEAFHVHVRTATRILQAMEDARLLIPVGAGCNSAYHLAPALEVVTSRPPNVQGPSPSADAAPTRRERLKSSAGPSR